MLPSHILCLNETRIQNIHTNQSILNALSKKKKSFVMLQWTWNNDTLWFNYVLNKNNLFNTFFNKNTQEAFYITVIYKLSQMQTNYLISISKITLK